VRQLTADYQDLHDSIAASLRPPTAGGPAVSRVTDIMLKVSIMRGELEKIRSLNYDAVLSANHAIQTAARQANRLVAAGLAVGLAFSIFFCYRIGRSILRPILALTGATRELGDGNLQGPVPVVTQDELGALAVAFNKMAGLLQKYRRSTTTEIVRLHRTMEATLASFPDPVFVLNPQGEIEMKNPAAASLAAALKLDNHLPVRLQDLAQSAMQSGQNYLPHDFATGLAFRYDGAEKFFLPRALVMRTREDALFGAAVVLQDVTRFRLLDAAKTNLVATVSHELTSPLTSVRMGLHLLLEKTLGALTSKQEELLQAARDDSERLLRILNDLLDLARLEEGGEELHREKVAPVELLQDMRDEMADRASAKAIKINCVVEPQLPPVSVDRQRIDHVFTNLIANAIKYSPDGGEIILRAGRTEAGSVQFSVSDHGPGIPEHYQARVFDRFFRVPGQDKNGAGLGLPIAREITVAHGGRIGVKSAPGRGSTFFVVLKPAS
jgi:signal transduction histidine kinase